MESKLNLSPTTHFLSFEIDTANILQYEYCQFEEKTSHEYYEIYDYLKTFLIKNGLTPFLTPEMVKSGQCGEDYYNNYIERRLPKRYLKEPLDFFEFQRSVYSLQEPFIVLPENSSPSDYFRLFFLKLKQYKDGLTFTHSFLFHHLKTFNGDRHSYFTFLKQLVMQYEELLTPGIIDQVNSFMSDPVIISKLEEQEKIALQKRLDNLGAFEHINGNLSRDEILHYFSFLYKEKSADDKPFLNQAAVDNIFQYGISIPLFPEFVNSYKLNYSHLFPRSIVEYCIYKFYEIYTDTSRGIGPICPSPKLKKEILKFFGSYLEDFKMALRSDRELENLNKNITGEKPKRMTFNPEDYYPERLL